MHQKEKGNDICLNEIEPNIAIGFLLLDLIKSRDYLANIQEINMPFSHQGQANIV